MRIIWECLCSFIRYTGLPRVREKSGNLKIFQGQWKVREVWNESVKFEILPKSQWKVRELCFLMKNCDLEEKCSEMPQILPSFWKKYYMHYIAKHMISGTFVCRDWSVKNDFGQGKVREFYIVWSVGTLKLSSPQIFFLKFILLFTFQLSTHSLEKPSKGM